MHLLRVSYVTGAAGGKLSPAAAANLCESITSVDRGAPPHKEWLTPKGKGDKPKRGVASRAKLSPARAVWDNSTAVTKDKDRDGDRRERPRSAPASRAHTRSATHRVAPMRRKGSRMSKSDRNGVSVEDLMSMAAPRDGSRLTASPSRTQLCAEPPESALLRLSEGVD